MGKNNNNYITSMEAKFGENWIFALTPENIQRSSKRVFKEMVTGKYDYEVVGKYFLDGKFLDNLIIACEYEIEVNTLLYNAVTFYIQYNPQIQNATIQQSHLQTLCYIYTVILQKLNAVKISGNIGAFVDLAAVLYSYRKHLD